ncbi:MAG TPA: hypothetical protein VGK19_08810 [Capsulimonadaceae bacterium]|jgi:hypothetical protein
MNKQLEEFTFGCMEAWGAVATELTGGVWRIQLPEGEGGLAAWYLGRPTGEILVTFDLARWEEGARLECLTVQSPLVRRLQQYAEARGAYAVITVPAAHKPGGTKHRYQPYLLCRFASRYRSVNVVEERRWMGMNLATGATVKVTGDPMSAAGLVEGEPDIDVRVEPVVSGVEAVTKLVGIWEAEVASRAQALATEAELLYRTESEEAMQVLEGDELAERLEILGERYAPVAESFLEAAALLWR